MMDLQAFKKLAEDRWLMVDRAQGKKVLELGCVNHSIKGIEEQQKLGTWLFDYLHKYASYATGLDIDRPAIDYLTQHGYDVRFGDAQNFNLPEKYDVIVISKVIDHLTNLDGFFQSCLKHLTPAGRIIIGDDNILCLPQLLIWNFKKTLGRPDDDITVKIIPEYFNHFVIRYSLKVDK